MAAVEEVLLPLQPHFLALHGLSKLLETIELVAEHVNPRLRLLGIVLCMYESGTRLAGEVGRDVQNFFESGQQRHAAWAGGRLFQTKIRRNIRLAEAPSFGQSIFDYAPEWFRKRANHQICPVTDLARLIVAKEFFSKGFERTIWIDADVLVFAPSQLKIEVKADFALCHETWIFKSPNGELAARSRVNNSIAVFTKGSIHLDFFIDACLRIAYQKTSIGKLDVGTVFFSQLRAILPFPLLKNVGIFGPAIVADIAAEGGPYLKEYARHLKSSIACANFCASLAVANDHQAAQLQNMYEAAVTKCLATQGAAINRFVHVPPSA
jgi:hypothetical protein